MAKTEADKRVAEARVAEAHDEVEAAKEEAKQLLEAAKAAEAQAKAEAKAVEAAAKEEAKALKAVDSAKAVKVRNRGVRGLALIKADNTSLFIGPKQTVEVSGDLVSESMKAQVKAGLIALEG